MAHKEQLDQLVPKALLDLKEKVVPQELREPQEHKAQEEIKGFKVPQVLKELLELKDN